MFFIAYVFKGQVHVLAGQVKMVSHSSCRTSAIFTLSPDGVYFLRSELVSFFVFNVRVYTCMYYTVFAYYMQNYLTLCLLAPSADNL